MVQGLIGRKLGKALKGSEIQPLAATLLGLIITVPVAAILWDSLPAHDAAESGPADGRDPLGDFPVTLAPLDSMEVLEGVVVGDYDGNLDNGGGLISIRT